MLKGIDVSHWQNDYRITADNDFVICKASDGANYHDKTFSTKLDLCKILGINLVGAYHFADLRNTPETDAVNFLRQIQTRDELGKNMILALDIENNAKYPLNIMTDPKTYEWCKKWLDVVYAETGIKPLLYISAAFTKYCEEIAAADYGLWVAHWKVKKPSFKSWKFFAFWQTGVENNLDQDVFNGTPEQFIKYCERN